MPKLGKHASKSAKRKRVRLEMHKYKHGQLHSGSKRGPLAKSRKQAIAIALNEAGLSKKRQRKRSYNK